MPTLHLLHSSYMSQKIWRYFCFNTTFNIRNCASFVLKVALAGGGMRLSDIVCNASLLGRYLTVDKRDSFPDLQKVLCAVPSNIMQKAEQIFLSQLDVSKILTVSEFMIQHSIFILCVVKGETKLFKINQLNQLLCIILL